MPVAVLYLMLLLPRVGDMVFVCLRGGMCRGVGMCDGD